MPSANNSLFPEISPYLTDYIDTDSEHRVFYEVSGNADGYPVVFLHGGPGSGCNPGQRRFFDPAFYKIILLDQRGCGRSSPLGETTNNTTADLVADLETIRHTLNIERWLVFGGSWGSTLALSYAIKHPEHTAGLILRGIFLSRKEELNWFLNDIKHFYPDVWHTLENHLPREKRDDVLRAYDALIFNDDPSINQPAAMAWNAYESSIMRLLPAVDKVGNTSNTTITDEVKSIEVARARIQIHYINHQCFVDGEMMLRHCDKLQNIPTTIVQGRYDMVCPPKSAWELSRALPNADFKIIPDAGHSAMETGVVAALVNATESFKHSQKA